MQALAKPNPAELDAVIVLGGGVTSLGEPNPWVIPRLEAAYAAFLANPSLFIICSSGGTPHKAPPLDPKGFPIFESVASVRYLEKKGVPADRILAETASYDTLGNAFFTRVIHTDIRKLSRLHIITSAFHLERTQQAFTFIFNLQPQSTQYVLSFAGVANRGLTPEVLISREAKEQLRLKQLRELQHNWQGDLAHFHALLFRWYSNYTFAWIPEAQTEKTVQSY